MGHKILVVEDDSFLVTAYKAKLTKEGFEVLIATDGQEALDILAKDKPELILMDLVMPRMDGFTALAEIRKREDLKGIPIIVTSNLGQQEDIKRAKELGATDFVTKSDMSLTDLVAKLQGILNK